MIQNKTKKKLKKNNIRSIEKSKKIKKIKKLKKIIDLNKLKQKKNKRDKKEKKETNSKSYDVIVVGGGIAGLYTAYNLLKKHNTKNINNNNTKNNKNNLKLLLVESNDYLGGRIYTNEEHNYETGAARFHDKQKRMIKLIKELNLEEHMVPISSKIKFMPYPSNRYMNINYFDKVVNINTIIDEIIELKNENIISYNEMINNSLLDLIDKKLDKKYPNIKKTLEEIYEYWSEISIMNSYDALKLFKNDFDTNKQFYVLNNGLSQINKTLEKQIRDYGGIIKKNTFIESIDKNEHLYILNNKYNCKKLILALPKHNLLKFAILNNDKTTKSLLNSVEESPLYRIYAKYPTNILNTYCWFHKLPKITTNLKIKYIIPINYQNGLIMISYTDGKHSKYWINKYLDENKIDEEIHKQLHKLFPTYEIPKPEWTKHHYWNAGAAYWKIGSESSKLIHKIIKPLNKENIFICGENYSNHQAWIEGALQTSDLVLKKIKI